jgi:hypothetical protein
MTTTVKQIEANRRNSERSKGPRTEQGKARSRANACSHGMAGAGFVLPEDETELVAERAEEWSGHYPLRTPEDFWFLDQLALESVRVERCQDQERALLCRQRVRADCRWDNEKRFEASRLFGKLSKRPAEVWMELQMTSQGCSLLIDRWQSLLGLLKPGKPWEESTRSMALDMLGVLAEFREAPTRIDAQEGQDAVEVQKAIAAREIERLTGLKEDKLDGLDDLERELAVIGMNAPDRDVQLMRRYESACRRRFDAALRALHLACQKDVALRMESPWTQTPPAEPSPSPRIDPRGFALLEETPSQPANPFDEDADLEERTRDEKMLDALEALAARIAAQDEQWDLKQAKAKAKATAVAAPESMDATAGRAGNRQEHRAGPSDARQAAG